MDAFLAAALAFPTVIFTIAVVAFVLYGLAIIFGALDVDSLDGAVGLDDGSDGIFEGALNAFGIAGVPLVVFGGAASIVAWLVSMFAWKLFAPASLFGMVIALLAGVAGLIGGALAVRPLRGFFRTSTARSNKDVVGRICTVRSVHVTDNGGTAEVEDGGAGFIAEVRCFRENELTLGSKAIIYDYDPKSGVYHVGPLDPSIIQADQV